MNRICLLAVLFFSGGVAAQTVISPKEFATAEGPSQNRFPFGDAAPFRFLQIHDDLKGGPLRLIRSMSFRRMGWNSFNNNDFFRDYAAYKVVLSMWCSTAKTTATTPNLTFDNNHGTDKKQVLSGVTINFPASVHAFVPNPFDYKLPFVLPFVWSASASFCWEVQMTSTTRMGNQYYDHAARTAANPPLATSVFGKGCKLSNASAAMTATGSSSMNWTGGTGTLVVTGQNGPPNSAVAFILGFDNTSFGGIPLPFLFPGSTNAPSGPCHLYTDIVLVLASATDASGKSTTNLPVPAMPALNGARTFEQLLAADGNANPLGLVGSNGVNHNWVAPVTSVPLARVYLGGSLGGTGRASSTNYGYVTKFN